MKTVFINASPKKRFSASANFIRLQRFFVKGTTVREHLRNKSDHLRVLESLKDADSVVFALPLYIDSLPTHIISFLKDLEAFSKENNLNLKIYVISNGGFIEGKQNAVVFRIFENFCKRSGNAWCGGVGIGGGVMLNVLTIVFYVQVALLFLNVILNGVQFGNWLPTDVFSGFGMQMLSIAFFYSGALFYIFRQGVHINKQAFSDVKFTRVMVPSFIFILITDIFFFIISIFNGGIFRGWLKKK